MSSTSEPLGAPADIGWMRDAKVISIVAIAHFVSHVFIMLLPPIMLLVKDHFRVDYTDIAMLSVNTRDKHYVLINENGQWILEDQPTEKLSQEAADLLVSRVANLPAEERVTKQPAPLAPYGLVAPTAEFVATGRDGKIAGRLTLGSQAGNLIYATGERLQGVFQARPDLLNQIPAKAELLAKPADKAQAAH